MFSAMSSWMENRTGLKKFIGMMLLEGVPGGARWRYVWGSTLAFVFSIQLITGIMLMTAYSPSASQAWSSVHYIQYKMDFGWFIRGLHHFGSQTMMVLMAFHIFQVVLAGAQLPPREWNWWTGIGLLSVTLGLSLTGYLLPWDQKGYWATNVATNISGTLPEVGKHVQLQAVGGPDSGNHTLTRFFALHVAILPMLLIGLLVVHIILFRRHGVTSPANTEGLVAKPENEHGPNVEPFWPRQLFYDMVACMFVFAVMVGLMFMPHQDEEGHWHYGHGNAVTTDREDLTWTDYDFWARAGERGVGANLDAPADRETPNYPARPEWYFLPLFQLLKYFKGDDSIYGTVVIPNGVMVLLALLPLFGYGPFRIVGRVLGILVVAALLAGVAVLIVLALRDDEPGGVYVPHYYTIPLLLLPVLAYSLACWMRLRGLAGPAAVLTIFAVSAALGWCLYEGVYNDELWIHVVHTEKDALETATKHQKELKLADAPAKRAVQMAMSGTPVDGGHELLRRDPLTKGYDLFQQKCGGCHNYSAKPGDPFKSWTGGESAGDLGDFASKEWIRSLLTDSMQDKHFGLVKNDVLDENAKPKRAHALTRMKGWRLGIDTTREKKWNKERVAQQEEEFDNIAAWLAEMRIPRDSTDPKYKRNDKLALTATAAFKSKANKCANCHTTEGRVEKDGKITWETIGGDTAPDLTNYGSAEWIRGMIMRPGHKSRYGFQDGVNLMPAFRPIDGPGSEVALQEFRETNPNTKDQNILGLSDIERELIIRFMLRDYRPIYGGSTIR